MARRAVDWTFQYHGAASGTIIADERLKGLGPYYGSELCTTVETMYSLSYLYHALGDNVFADRAELAAFNALPVAMTPDNWAHQYLTLPNQPWARYLDGKTPFWNVNGWGTTFGMEPNYPCCTVNHPQGYPKFLSASWAKLGDNGLAHVLLSPGVANTRLSSGDVRVSCETDYPFHNKLLYEITASKPFQFHVRVPGWAFGASSFTMNDDVSVHSLSPDASTGIHTFNIGAGTTKVTVTMNHNIQIQPRANNSIAVFSGPILYALQLGADTSSTTPRHHNTERLILPMDIPSKARDFEIVNTTPWNIAIDPSTLTFHSSLGPTDNLAEPLWAPGSPPTWIEGRGCEIDWPLWKGVPGPVPLERNCEGGSIRVKLVPYGSAKIHMSEFPTVDLKAAGVQAEEDEDDGGAVVDKTDRARSRNFTAS
jgi:hypothetical protein